MNDKIVPLKDHLNADFWNNLYLHQATTWDMGRPSPPLKSFIDTILDKSINILIPGAGRAYEAKYLIEQGFRSVTIIDIAPSLIVTLKSSFAATPLQIVFGDFFNHSGQYDLILEQTFFCAIHPDLRKDYVIKMSELLKPGGRLVGVLFDRSFEGEGPPFGGSASEYESLFKEHFQSRYISPCYNSIPARAGSEVFIIMQKFL
jgi:methyl halide transferase